MKSTRIVAVAAIVASGLSLNANAGVSVSVGEPGFYGHIEIGNLPRPPQLVFPEPVIVQRVPAAVAPAPIYLHVPPGHEKHWSKHCRKYNACGQPVYFIQDNWYNNEYVPEYRKTHGKGHGDDDHGGKHHGDDRGDDDHGEKHGDRGHGHGKDKD